jgi:hypothetical protein
MSTDAAKAFGGMLSENTTLKTLDVSNNSFGKLAVGDQMKLQSSGEMKIVTRYDSSSGILNEGKTNAWTKHSDYEWESQVPALCAGVAASQSLTSVSDFLTCTSCFFFSCTSHFFFFFFVHR